MKLSYLTPAIALILVACGDSDTAAPEQETPVHSRDAAWTPPEGLPDFAERQDPNPGGGSWINRLEPQPNEFCTFAEKPVSVRPGELILTAWSGNLDLFVTPDTLEHHPADGFIKSRFVSKGLVVASRQGMDDVWIEPTGEDVTLSIGADEFTCRQTETSTDG